MDAATPKSVNVESLKGIDWVSDVTIQPGKDEELPGGWVNWWVKLPRELDEYLRSIKDVHPDGKRSDGRLGFGHLDDLSNTVKIGRFREGWAWHGPKKHMVRLKWNGSLIPTLTQFKLLTRVDDYGDIVLDVTKMRMWGKPEGAVPDVIPPTTAETQSSENTCWGYVLLYGYEIKFGIGDDADVRENVHTKKVRKITDREYRVKFPDRDKGVAWENCMNGRSNGAGLLKDHLTTDKLKGREWIDTKKIHHVEAIRILLLVALRTFKATPDTDDKYTFNVSNL